MNHWTSLSPTAEISRSVLEQICERSIFLTALNYDVVYQKVVQMQVPGVASKFKVRNTMSSQPRMHTLCRFTF